MALGLLGRLDQVEKLQDPARRYTDIACQFWVAELIGSQPVYTGTHSQVYGGRWDAWAREYVAPAEHVLHIPCSQPQFEFIEDDAEIVEGSGGRGAGKSEAGVRKSLRAICERPLVRARAVSPTYDLTQVLWGKFLDLLMWAKWLLPGLEGIRRGDRELWTVNGVQLQFRSAHNPDALRSWGGAWCMLDEDQDITTEAHDILWPCLREAGDHPQMWMQLTPKPGEPYERHLVYEDDEDCSQIGFGSYTNVFISHRTFNSARKRMDKSRYQVEIEADWSVIAKLHEEQQDKPVFAGVFDRDVHRWAGGGRDITGIVAHKKVGRLRGYNWRWIAGVDPNGSVPNYCTIYKVFAPLQPGQPNRWVAMHFVAAKGHCGHLGQRLKQLGFKPQETLIVPDFSSRYNKLNNPKSSSQLLRGEGFYCVSKPKNPLVKHSIDDWMAKLDPADEGSGPSWSINLPECEPLAANMEAVLWNAAGDGFDKSVRPDPVDSARYPISYFEPALRYKRKHRWSEAA